MSNHSEFLTFSRKDDKFVAEANDSTALGISFLRMEFARVRVGMNDYLIKVASPKSADTGKSNTIITLRGNRRQGSSSGALATAKVIIQEMVKREDETTDWSRVNAEHLARMIAPALKFFSTNTSADRLQYVTEAIS